MEDWREIIVLVERLDAKKPFANTGKTSSHLGDLTFLQTRAIFRVSGFTRVEVDITTYQSNIGSEHSAKAMQVTTW
jgi:hypothetical protein